MSPAANGSVDISTEVGPAHFSWKNENEAASYRVKIFREGRASNPLINQVTSKNFLEVLPANVSLGEGKWYWSVAQIDDEGNESKASEERMFYAQRGKLFVRTIEPQEGYRVANTFAADMKFTWKQNLPGDFVNTLQVSTSPNFTTLVYQARVVGNSASSIAFAESRYYWRIHSKNDAGMILDTQPKSFEVLPQLDAPTVLAPLGRAVVHPDSPYAFKWQDVDGADFYKLAIYRQSDGELVYENNLYQLGVEIPMYDAPGFTDRSVYRYELQARANAVEGKGSRRNGRLAEGNFLLVKIRPVDVVSPARDSVIEGVDAVMKPLSVRWSSVEEPAKSQLVISKVDGKDRTPLLTYPAGVSFEQGRPKIPYSMSIELPDTFDAGNYELVVYAQTSDGYDISNTDVKNIGRFRITPVAPLNSIGSLSVTPRTMNAEYLMVETNPRNFTFAWSPVKDATHYLVQVNDKRGKPILPRIEVSAKETSYKFDFLAVEDEKIKEKLMNGTFQASVQAVRKIDTNKDGKVDKILQRSPVKTQNFSVDVGDPKKARGKKGAKNPYGL